MAPTPFRRRRKAARIARNLALAEAALSFAKDRAARSGGGGRRGRLLVAGGAVVAAGAAAAILARDKVAGLLPSRSDDSAATSAPAPPQPSNYDAPGPVANTATPIPAPDPAVRPATDAGATTPTGDAGPTRPAIDERAEEDAAAAEAAAIGGTQSDYAGLHEDLPADEADRPVVEAGGGEAEGQEQTEAELVANATVRDQAPSDAERQIDDAIEAQDEPASGETPEPLAPAEDAGDRVADASEGIVPPPGTEGGGISGRPGARLEDAAETPGVPPTGSPATPPETGDREDGEDRETWSGRPG
jgi:hypothetical protein